MTVGTLGQGIQPTAPEDPVLIDTPAMIVGPGVRGGNFQLQNYPAHLRDVAPTLAYVLGLPFVPDWAGKPWFEVFSQLFASQQPQQQPQPGPPPGALNNKNDSPVAASPGTSSTSTVSAQNLDPEIREQVLQAISGIGGMTPDQIDAMKQGIVSEARRPPPNQGVERSNSEGDVMGPPLPPHLRAALMQRDRPQNELRSQQASTGQGCYGPICVGVVQKRS
eukprot:c17704_g1_i5.p1 GENE.c17704_g1_i5~~c17704_g1_i5.p1  ORF type:complete len:221 (+),score=29.21 c17704_g1_i5:768-1430(+)